MGVQSRERECKGKKAQKKRKKERFSALGDDDPFIVLTETKFSFRCIPVWIGTLLIQRPQARGFKGILGP